MGLGSRPDCHRSWYSTFAPFLDTCPRNQPALGQTYATVVFREGRVSREQMLTVGRGLWTTATDQWRAFPASGLAAVIYVSDNCLCTQHSALWSRRRVIMQRQTNCLQIAHPRHSTRSDMSSLCDTKPGRSAKREIQGRV